MSCSVTHMARPKGSHSGLTPLVFWHTFAPLNSALWGLIQPLACYCNIPGLKRTKPDYFNAKISTIFLGNGPGHIRLVRETALSTTQPFAASFLRTHTKVTPWRDKPRTLSGRRQMTMIQTGCLVIGAVRRVSYSMTWSLLDDQLRVCDNLQQCLCSSRSADVRCTAWLCTPASDRSDSSGCRGSAIP